MADATMPSKAAPALAPPGVALLAGLAALGQFAGNIYTPALPALARDFAVPAGDIQLTIAVFLAVFAAGQLFAGPVSDRFGRRPVLHAGLAVFVLGSVLCALASSFAFLMTGRIVQAAGAAAAIVMSRAITRDSYDGPELTRMLAAITIVFALVPGLTPLLGGAVEQLLGWRISLWITALAGLAMVATTLRLPETLARPTARLSFSSAFADYGRILADAPFRTYALAAAVVMGSLSAFFAGSPILFIEAIGMTPIEYGLYPPLSIAGFMLGGLATRRLAGRIAPERLALAGLLVLLAGAAILLGAALLGRFERAIFAGAMVVHITGLGLFLPTATAAALSRFRERAGAAAAMLGFLQMAGGAIGTLAVSLLQAPLPLIAFPTAMFAATALALAIFTLGAHRQVTERPQS